MDIFTRQSLWLVIQMYNSIVWWICFRLFTKWKVFRLKSNISSRISLRKPNYEKNSSKFKTCWPCGYQSHSVKSFSLQKSQEATPNVNLRPLQRPKYIYPSMEETRITYYFQVILQFEAFYSCVFFFFLLMKDPL